MADNRRSEAIDIVAKKVYMATALDGSNPRQFMPDLDPPTQLEVINRAGEFFAQLEPSADEWEAAYEYLQGWGDSA